ncbi:sporulation protein YpjB [Paenibacillus sp. NFR01]|uniref:sporulation protein YpjB n=1 Tax=Paenibacillus sp. NFR01 TaxID=1566279 RepID=UPI0008AB2003|nr:sporulation protein YpjB [Paenibacillus sp. NFR01]SET51734.1 sporulation protein YpjB [Paenibacillus sp. NFR01]
MPRKRYVAAIVLALCWLLAAFQNKMIFAQGAESPALTGSNGAQQLEQAAESLYTYVLEGNVPKARQQADEVSRIFISSSFEGLTSVEGINALSAVILELKSTMASAQISPEKWEASAAKLRLAANSLNHPQQPMWQQYYKVIREDLSALGKSAAAGDLSGWKTAVAQLKSRYDTIRPAVIISSKPETVQAFDSWLSYAEGIPASSQPVSRSRLLEIVSYGNDATARLFGKTGEEPALSRPLATPELGVWGVLGGAFIALALVYTAFRKYRGDSEDWKTV